MVLRFFVVRRREPGRDLALGPVRSGEEDPRPFATLAGSGSGR